MTGPELLSEEDAQVLTDGIAHACLHGMDQDRLDTLEEAPRLVAATRVAADHGGRLLDDTVAGARRAAIVGRRSAARSGEQAGRTAAFRHHHRRT